MGLSVIGLEGRVNYAITYTDQSEVKPKLQTKMQSRSLDIQLTVVVFTSCSYSGSNWIALVPVSGASWELRMYVNLTRRSDTGRLNTSPVATMTPIVRLKYGCNHSIVIPGMCTSENLKCKFTNFFFPSHIFSLLILIFFVVVFYSSSSSSPVLLVLDIVLSFFVAFRPSCFLFFWHLLCETLFLTLLWFCFVFVFVFCMKFFGTSFFF